MTRIPSAIPAEGVTGQNTVMADRKASLQADCRLEPCFGSHDVR